MKTNKYDVLKGFKHPHTKKVFTEGETVELTDAAAIGLMGYVKKVTEDKEIKAKTSQKKA